MEDRETRKQLMREIEDLLEDADVPTIEAIIEFIQDII